jgi:hypothetical protein
MILNIMKSEQVQMEHMIKNSFLESSKQLDKMKEIEKMMKTQNMLKSRFSKPIECVYQVPEEVENLKKLIQDGKDLNAEKMRNVKHIAQTQVVEILTEAHIYK